MEEKIIKKVAKFLELSKKFSKSEFDVVPQKKEFSDAAYATVTTGSGIQGMQVGSSFLNMPSQNSFDCFIEGRKLYVDKSGNVKAEDEKEVTRAEKIRVNAEAKADLLEEYYEYAELQKELSEYFNVLEKITK